MKKLINHTLSDYLKSLSQKTPAPGGGSVAALSSALGVGLILMVTNYSLGRSSLKRVEARLKKIRSDAEVLQKRLMVLVDLDAEAYANVVKTRKASPKIKRQALKKARDVPKEVMKLSQTAIKWTPFLVTYGNKYLLSDVDVALDMLTAGYNAAKRNVEVNS